MNPNTQRKTDEVVETVKKEIDKLCYHKIGIVRGGPYSDDKFRGPNEETVTLVKKEDVYTLLPLITTLINQVRHERDMEWYDGLQNVKGDLVFIDRLANAVDGITGIKNYRGKLQPNKEN